MLAFAWIAGSLAVLMGFYGVHQFCLHLERRGLMYYWHEKSTGGSAYNPLQEFIQPQIRHVVEVREQRVEEDDEGAPPNPRTPVP